AGVKGDSAAMDCRGADRGVIGVNVRAPDVRGDPAGRAGIVDATPNLAAVGHRVCIPGIARAGIYDQVRIATVACGGKPPAAIRELPADLVRLRRADGVTVRRSFKLVLACP